MQEQQKPKRPPPPLPPISRKAPPSLNKPMSSPSDEAESTKPDSFGVAPRPGRGAASDPAKAPVTMSLEGPPPTIALSAEPQTSGASREVLGVASVTMDTTLPRAASAHVTDSEPIKADGIQLDLHDEMPARSKEVALPSHTSALLAGTPATASPAMCNNERRGTPPSQWSSTSTSEPKSLFARLRAFFGGK